MSDAAGGPPSSAPSAPTGKTGGAPSSPASSPSRGAPTSGAAPARNTSPNTPAPSKAGSPPPSNGNEKRSLADQVKKPEAAAETPKQVEVRKELERRKYQFKVDGKEWEEELDDNEIRTRLQKGHAADKRMQEAAELRKKFQDAMAYGKENIPDALKTLFGVDADEWLEQRLESRYKEAMLSPEEKERQTLQKELERYRKQEADAKTKAEETQRQAYERQIWEKTEQDFIGALDKLGYDNGVNKMLLPMMADLAEAALDAGMDLDADLLAHEANKRLQNVNQHRIRSLKGESLLKELGPDVVREVLRARLEQTRLAPASTPAPAAPAPKKAAEPQEPKQRDPGAASRFRKKHLFGL